MSLARRRQPPERPRRERDPGEYASFKLQPTRAVMVARIDATSPPRAAPTPAPAPRLAPPHETESAYMGEVARLGCIVCRLLGHGFVPCQVHHIREGQGGAQRAGHFCTLGLCEPHHTGDYGIHGDRRYMRLLKVDEVDLLDLTIGWVFCRLTGRRDFAASPVNPDGRLSARGDRPSLPIDGGDTLP